MPAAKLQCPTCPRTYTTQSNLNKHLKTGCNGCVPLQCPVCKEAFPDKRSKYEHKLRDSCDQQPETDSATFNNDLTIFNNDISSVNNGIINNGTINAGVINNIHINLNVPLLDYAKTDIKAVIDGIVKNPAFIQVAHQNNLLHEAIIDKTHYSGPVQHRNVFGIDKKGTVSGEFHPVTDARGIPPCVS